jgi:hypothetical protein
MVIAIFPAVLTFFLVLFPFLIQEAMFEIFLLLGRTCQRSPSTAYWPHHKGCR